MNEQDIDGQLLFEGIGVDVEVAGEKFHSVKQFEGDTDTDDDADTTGATSDEFVRGGATAHRAGVVDAVHDYTLSQGRRRGRRLPGHWPGTLH